MPITKQQVIAALAELRVNRPRHLADQNIRSLLHTYGAGAANIGELKEEFYFHVFCAAGGAGSVCAPRTNKAPAAREPSSRIRSPLTIDLESRLAARAGKPRSKPTMRVDYGSPAHFGDQQDDVVRDFPAGERVR